MAKNNNKGFSLVEIIIAIAVFAILIVPLTTQLISAIGVNKDSTKKQYAIEKAEGIMENFKVCSFPENVGDTVVIDGSYTFTKSASTPQSKTLSNGETVNYTEDTYQCNDITLGTSYETYNCEVTVNNLAYAVSAAGYIYDRETQDIKIDGEGNPVQSPAATGTVRALDNKQFAIITGATYTGPTGVDGNNLDMQAYRYFNDVKVDLLKNYETYYNQYLSGGTYFDSDYFDKYTTIEVSKSAGEYIVKCIVRYVDHTNSIVSGIYTNNEYFPDTVYGTRSGVVYQQSFEKLPPIYLLYMPATYNNIYCSDDHISIDTSGISGEDVSIYLFESAADIDAEYGDLVVNYFNSSSIGYNISDVEDLVFENPVDSTKQQNVQVHVMKAGGDLDDMSVYTNFSVAADSDVPIKTLAEDENSNVYLYDIHVKLTSSEGIETEISGTRGK